jgi:uncharacterized protein
MKRFASDPIASSIVTAVAFCSRFRWIVLAASVLLTVVSANYALTHFAINTNTNVPKKLQWRQNLIALDKAFPQRVDQIIVVVDGATAELAEAAAQALTDKLKARSDLYSSLVRPDGGAYFNQNGLLFLPLPELRKTISDLSRARAFLIALSFDPSVRGIVTAISYINQGVRAQAGTLDDFDRPMVQFGGTLEGILSGQPVFFSWRSLVSGQPPDPRELRKFIVVKPILDYAGLMPGEKASNFIRGTARNLGFSPAHGVTVRLTGLVPMADEEFANLADGAGLNGVVTALTVLFLVWLALKSGRIVLAVALTVVVGLALTAAAGLAMVGALNLISVAFAVLFVGIGVDSLRLWGRPAKLVQRAKTPEPACLWPPGYAHHFSGGAIVGAESSMI